MYSFDGGVELERGLVEPPPAWHGVHPGGRPQVREVGAAEERRQPRVRREDLGLDQPPGLPPAS